MGRIAASRALAHAQSQQSDVLAYIDGIGNRA